MFKEHVHAHYVINSCSVRRVGSYSKRFRRCGSVNGGNEVLKELK